MTDVLLQATDDKYEDIIEERGKIRSKMSKEEGVVMNHHTFNFFTKEGKILKDSDQVDNGAEIRSTLQFSKSS